MANSIKMGDPALPSIGRTNDTEKRTNDRIATSGVHHMPSLLGLPCARAPRPSAATCGPGQPVPGSCPASPSAAAGPAVPPATTLQSLRRRHRRQFCSPQPRVRFSVSGDGTTHSPSYPAGNHVGEGGLWHLGDALRSRRVDLDGGGRARGAVAGRRQPPSASRRRFAKTGGVIGCCSQAAADKDMNNIPAQAVARAAAGGAISTHSRHRCTCVLPLPPNSAPLSSTRAHPIICSQADCGVCCAMPTHQTLARA